MIGMVFSGAEIPLRFYEKQSLLGSSWVHRFPARIPTPKWMETPSRFESITCARGKVCARPNLFDSGIKSALTPGQRWRDVQAQYGEPPKA